MTGNPAPILASAPSTEPIAIEGREAVPVTLLTGFLGAGKATLLNRILDGQQGLRLGVLVNDFGAINLDAELVDGVEENTISLTSGCVCCEIRDDLVNSLERLLMRADAIDYVILEASGVIDPEGIVMTFLNKRYERLLRLDSITRIVDAEASLVTKFAHCEPVVSPLASCGRRRIIHLRDRHVGKSRDGWHGESDRYFQRRRCLGEPPPA